MSYLVHLLIYFDIYLIVALSLNLVVGYCGLFTLAHAAYYAIGGYGYALLALNLGWSFPPAVLVAALVSAVFSLAISLPAWRLKGDFFVLDGNDLVEDVGHGRVWFRSDLDYPCLARPA